LIRGAWPERLEKVLRRFTWSDPTAVVDPSASAAAFREAMKAFYFGGTFKITGSSRHPLGDQLLMRHVPLAGANIVDIGASDGSTSLDLIRAVGDFGSFTLADRYLVTTVRRWRGLTFFFDGDDICVLVVSRRLLAWPSMSPMVARVLRPTIRAARRSDPGRRVVLLNPEVRSAMERDARIRFAEHDIFTLWPGEPQVIKVANLLRLLYFSESQISLGLRAVLSSLASGGYFLLVDNPRVQGIAERSGLYQRRDDRFVVVEETDQRPEISDLVTSVRLSRRG
jgi:hypothetical protein